MTAVGLLPNLDLKRKRKVQEVEKGEVIPPKGAKQPKNAKDKRAPSVESREESNGAKVCRGGAHLGPLVRNGWCSHPLGCHNLGVSKGVCHPPRQGLRVAPSPPQRYGGPQVYQATGPFHVTEEGPRNGKSVNILCC